jgi:putative flippase GtrA
MPQVKRSSAARPPADTASNPVGAPDRSLIGLAGRLLAFVFAGGIGFGVDMLGTLTLINFGLNPLLARAIAIAAALLATYAINRGVTFRRQASTTPRGTLYESARYGAVGLATSFLNWLVFAGTMALVTGIHPALALVISSAVAMVASYVGYARFAFRG